MPSRIDTDLKRIKSVVQSSSDADLLYEVARALIQRAVEVDGIKASGVQKWECTHCGIKARSIEDIEERFGFRLWRGRQYANSWCRNCRRLPDAHPGTGHHGPGVQVNSWGSGSFSS